MSETDPRFNAIEVRKTDNKMQVSDDYERSDWIGASTAIDKIGKAMETLEQNPSEFLLPSGMSIDDIKNWVPKAAHTLNRNKIVERKEGRTGLEQWAFPANYANLPGSMGRGMNTSDQLDSSIYGGNDINVAELIYDEISIHGRATLDEICRNIGAVDDKMLTVVVNSLLVDKFLVPYTEEDGTKTLELIEAVTRNNMLGIIPEEKPELENKEEERSVSGTQNVEDNVTVYEFQDMEWPEDVVVKEPPKFKIPNSHFEQ